MSRLFFGIIALSPVVALHGEIALPPLISDNMVLAHPKAAIWGTADPNEEVTVTFNNASAIVTADAEGKWRAELNGLRAGEVGEMTVAGVNRLVIRNVVVGEVWVASGQSNMALPLSLVDDSADEIAKAKYSGIRMFSIYFDPKRWSAVPLDEVPGKWVVCDPSAVRTWSATGYFFARNLHEALRRPIGIISSSRPATPIEAWTPKEVIDADPEVSREVYGGWQKLMEAYPKAREVYEQRMARWKEAAEAAKAAGKPIPPKPAAPIGPQSVRAPSVLYHTMIHGALPFTVHGFIWYQGENNASRAALYRRQLPALMRSWRERWNAPGAPFYIVQLANYRKRLSDPAPSAWAELRDVQREVARGDRASGLAVTIDIGDAKDIHPTNKQEVGRRLALLALKNTYGQLLVSTGPIFSEAEFRDGAAEISFEPESAEGLKTLDHTDPRGFILAGEDQVFFNATAEITSSGTIEVRSPEVSNPVAVRYGWADNPDVNLINKGNLPASPFRSDDWPFPPRE